LHKSSLLNKIFVLSEKNKKQVKKSHMLTNVLYPDRYHGFSAKPPYFEGWYYKLVSADENTRFVVIPGIYIAADPAKSHCFVQVFDSQADQVNFHRYPIDAFKASKNAFEIHVEDNVFTADHISLAIDDNLGQLKGSLTFSDLCPWPVRFFSPGAMGWFAWVPFMECYHGVVSMDHTIRGQLIRNGQPMDFTGGCGYIEKDWGKQFPSAWIWGQSNHFSKPGISLMMSVAVIPWLGGSFGGFIVGLLFNGVIHRFATYNQSKIDSLKAQGANFDLQLQNKTHRLRVQGVRKKGVVLQAPTSLEMDRRIIETLDAHFDIRFETKTGELIYEGSGLHAGLEVVGDVQKLIAKVS
jgi:hypothetical protein